MIHPQDWSLSSIYYTITKSIDKQGSMTIEEVRHYLEFLQPKGKCILDIGAYNGDSAKLFLKHGAKRVICIEIDPEYAKKIPKDPRIEVLCEAFDPEKHLKYFGLADAVKIDIEGYEMLLIPYMDEVDRLKVPIIVETHDFYTLEKFKEKGFKMIYNHKRSPLISLVGKDYKE